MDLYDSDNYFKVDSFTIGKVSKACKITLVLGDFGAKLDAGLEYSRIECSCLPLLTSPIPAQSQHSTARRCHSNNHKTFLFVDIKLSFITTLSIAIHNLRCGNSILKVNKYLCTLVIHDPVRIIISSGFLSSAIFSLSKFHRIVFFLIASIAPRVPFPPSNLVKV